MILIRKFSAIVIFISSTIAGPKFVIYCTKHLLLPMIQCWLRSGAKKFGYWDSGATNFKQCCGHTTDLIVDLVHDFKGRYGIWIVEVKIEQKLCFSKSSLEPTTLYFQTIIMYEFFLIRRTMNYAAVIHPKCFL